MSTALKWKTPAEIYAAPVRPDWWGAWVAHLAGISADPHDPRRENEVWRWYETLWLQDPLILEEIGTRAARGVAGECEEAKARGYASIAVWRLAVAEEARLAEEREQAERAEVAKQDRIELARRKEVWRERFQQLAQIRLKSLPPYAEWVAWQWGHGAKARFIATVLGRPHNVSMVSAAVRHYIEAHLPDVLLPSRWGNGPPELPDDRRAALLAHFGDRPEPPLPELQPPASPEEDVGRNRQIYEQRLAGRTFKAIAGEFGITGTRASQIFAKQQRRERRREQAEASIAAIDRWIGEQTPRRNLGRPLDMGGPRDVWIEDEPWTPDILKKPASKKR